MDIMVHTTSKALKKALMKMRRCIGFRKCREQQNVAMMTTTPKADRAEAVRVTVSSVVHCSSDNFASPRGYSMIDCSVVTFELSRRPVAFVRGPTVDVERAEKSKMQFYIA